MGDSRFQGLSSCLGSDLALERAKVVSPHLVPQFPNLQWFPAAGQRGCDVPGYSSAKWQQLCWQCAQCLLLVAGDADACPQCLWAQSLAWTSEPLWPEIPGNLLLFTMYCQWKFLAARAFWEGTEGVPGWPSCRWCQGLAELKV